MKTSLTSKFAILIGIFLLIEGIWGTFSPVVFGVLATNTLHAIIHIILGAVGIYLGMKNKARGFCMFLGILLIAVGILRFVPGADDVIAQLLNVNPPVAYLNMIVGLISLLLALAEKKSAIITSTRKA